MQSLDTQTIVLVILALVGLGLLAALVALVFLALAARGGAAAASRFKPQRVAGADLEQYFAEKATFATAVRLEYDSTPERVWQALLDESFWSWWPTVKGYEYLTDSLELGTHRAFIGAFAAVEEEFILFEPGTALSSTFVGSYLPVFRDFAGRFELMPNADGGTTVNWTVGVSPILVHWLPLRWTAPFVRPFLKLVLFGLREKVEARPQGA